MESGTKWGRLRRERHGIRCLDRSTWWVVLGVPPPDVRQRAGATGEPEAASPRMFRSHVLLAAPGLGSGATTAGMG